MKRIYFVKFKVWAIPLSLNNSFSECEVHLNKNLRTGFFEVTLPDKVTVGFFNELRETLALEQAEKIKALD